MKYLFKRYMRGYNRKRHHQSITKIKPTKRNYTIGVKLSKRTMKPANRHRFKSTGKQILKKQITLSY